MNEPKFLGSLASIESWREKVSTGKSPAKVVLRKEFVSEIEVQPNRSVKFVITTGAPDREKDIIDPDGWDVSG
jgi:hypothetical protein